MRTLESPPPPLPVVLFPCFCLRGAPPDSVRKDAPSSGIPPWLAPHQREEMGVTKRQMMVGGWAGGRLVHYTSGGTLLPKSSPTTTLEQSFSLCGE